MKIETMKEITKTNEIIINRLYEKIGYQFTVDETDDDNYESIDIIDRYGKYEIGYSKKLGMWKCRTGGAYGDDFWLESLVFSNQPTSIELMIYDDIEKILIECASDTEKTDRLIHNCELIDYYIDEINEINEKLKFLDYTVYEQYKNDDDDYMLVVRRREFSKPNYINIYQPYFSQYNTEIIRFGEDKDMDYYFSTSSLDEYLSEYDYRQYYNNVNHVIDEAKGYLQSQLEKYNEKIEKQKIYNSVIDDFLDQQNELMLRTDIDIKIDDWNNDINVSGYLTIDYDENIIYYELDNDTYIYNITDYDIFVDYPVLEWIPALIKFGKKNQSELIDEIFKNEMMDEIFQDEINEIFRSEMLEEKYR